VFQSRLAVLGPVAVAVTLNGVPGVKQLQLVVNELDVPYPEFVLLQLVEAKTLR
jgi:hypothetical protein